jgi:hypothetical protein
MASAIETISVRRSLSGEPAAAVRLFRSGAGGHKYPHWLARDRGGLVAISFTT